MDVHHPTVKTMVAWGSRFARRSVLNERPLPWAVLIGKSGCGKSRVARRACRIVKENILDAWCAGRWGGREIPSVAWVEWARTVETKELDDYEDLARDIREAKIVFIDDLGAEVDRFGKGETVSRLRRLLDDLERKAVFITTNLRPSEWEAKWDSRVASRLAMAKHLDCSEVPDYRPTLATR